MGTKVKFNDDEGENTVIKKVNNKWKQRRRMWIRNERRLTKLTKVKAKAEAEKESPKGQKVMKE